MALDTFTTLYNQVLLRAPDVGVFLSQTFVRNAFRRLGERRRWSWLIKFGQFIVPAVYNTGTVSVTQGSTTVTGSGTGWTQSLLYRQFRIGLNSPIYTIISIDDGAQTLELSSAWGGTTGSAQVYTIVQCFFPVPTNFHAFLTVWDPAMNWQLILNVKQEELNIWDAQRANFGNAYMVSFRDQSIYYNGWQTGDPPVPRYELWPYITARTIPYLYEARAEDIAEGGIVLPRFIPGDVLYEMALAEAAAFPGTNQKRNSYFDMAVSRRHDARAEFLIAECERQDDETDMQDVINSYGVPGAFATPWGDARFIQDHAIW